MKTLAFIAPTQLMDDGTLQIKNFRSMKCLVIYLKCSYDITLIVQAHREKLIPELNDLDVSIIYDTVPQKGEALSVPSRFRESYLKWAARDAVDTNQTSVEYSARYDRLVGWDACSPWCLSTASTSVVAERRVLWLHDDPNLYLMAEDHAFYAELCDEFNYVIAPDTKMEQSLTSICGSHLESKKHTSLQLPVDVDWYWNRSEQPPKCDFSANEINLLAIGCMSMECDMEILPCIIAQMRKQYPSLHCYIIGDGERLDRYIQQVALYDLDSSFSFLCAQENPYPYLKACDALVVSANGNGKAKDMEVAAGIFGVPIVPLDKLEQTKWKKKNDICVQAENAITWSDSEKFIDILEGVIEK